MTHAQNSLSGSRPHSGLPDALYIPTPTPISVPGHIPGLVHVDPEPVRLSSVLPEQGLGDSGWPAEHKIVLLNGPPRCGKDTAAMGLLNHFHSQKRNAYHHKFASPLADGLRGMFGIDPGRWMYLYATAKEEACDELLGMSPREAMIWLSEDVMKPEFGGDVFGRLAANAITTLPSGTIVISDCGFPKEIVPVALLPSVGWRNLLIVNVHRPGCSFKGDSRGYISPENLRTAVLSSDYGDDGFDPDNGAPSFVDVVNRTDVLDFREEVNGVVDRWLNS